MATLRTPIITNDVMEYKVSYCNNLQSAFNSEAYSKQFMVEVLINEMSVAVYFSDTKTTAPDRCALGSFVSRDYYSSRKREAAPWYICFVPFCLALHNETGPL